MLFIQIEVVDHHTNSVWVIFLLSFAFVLNCKHTFFVDGSNPLCKQEIFRVLFCCIPLRSVHIKFTNDFGF